jgi:hypothetical protein
MKLPLEKNGEVMENVHFVGLSAKLVGDSPLVCIYPFLQIIATDWDLNLNKRKDWKVANKILINSVINN